VCFKSEQFWFHNSVSFKNRNLQTAHIFNPQTIRYVQNYLLFNSIKVTRQKSELLEVSERLSLILALWWLWI